MNNFPVYVSRRFWPWPKKYICRGVFWGMYSGGGQLINQNVLQLTLANNEMVYVDFSHRVIRYGSQYFDMKIQELDEEDGK